jgi:c-di-GMP-binding flagellar brake protein YcgR
MMSPAQALTPQPLEFEAMNLQVGSRLQLVTHRRVKPVQHFSTLVGYVKDEYMIVRIPLENGAPIALTEGERLTIRAFSGVNVCSFACTVERVFGRPLLYVHVSFPTEIVGSNLRTAMRVKVDLPAQVLGSEPAGAPVQCTLANLSVNGALVEAERRLADAGEEITLQITVVAPPGNQEVVVRTRAAIRNVKVLKARPEQDEKFTYGVQFSHLDFAHYTLLQNLTYEALLADRQKIV